MNETETKNRRMKIKKKKKKSQGSSDPRFILPRSRKTPGSKSLFYDNLYVRLRLCAYFTSLALTRHMTCKSQESSLAAIRVIRVFGEGAGQVRSGQGEAPAGFPTKNYIGSWRKLIPYSLPLHKERQIDKRILGGGASFQAPPTLSVELAPHWVGRATCGESLDKKKTFIENLPPPSPQSLPSTY